MSFLGIQLARPQGLDHGCVTHEQRQLMLAQEHIRTHQSLPMALMLWLDWVT
jgi:hypothetical protein